MYDVSTAFCDKCDSRIDDGDEVYCQGCIEFMKDEIEEQRKEIERLEAENAALDESISAATQIIEKLQRGEMK